jgi:hypothetical protein
MALAGGRWKEKAARSIQSYRDRRAGEVHRVITSGGPIPQRLRNSYHLYLRSFASTAHVKVVLKSWTAAHSSPRRIAVLAALPQLPDQAR